MITGFNTDVEHDGVVYHVQTEDKGLESPIILSLVYSGGAILASKRAPYEDLIASGFSDEVLAERLKRQHRLICAAIHSGRIDDLKKMSSRTGETGPLTAPLVALPVEAPTPATEEQQPSELEESVEVSAEIQSDPDIIVEEEPLPETEARIVTNIEDEIVRGFDVEPGIIHDLKIEQEIILDLAAQRALEAEREQAEEQVVEADPADEQEAQADQEAYTIYDPRRSADSIAGETNDGVAITLLDDDEFFSGETRMLRVLVTERRGAKEKALSNVLVSVKILGTAFRPLLYSVKTERDGVAIISTDIPQFNTGRAAVLIRVTAKESSAELRRVIHPVQT